MITTKHLSFGYKSGKHVFSDLELSLPKGSIVGLLGRNGEGKTTLLKNLYGQLFSKEGEVDVLGFIPRERKVAFLQQVYMLPEEIHVPQMRIRRYFDLSAPFYPTYDEAVAQELIDVFGLDWKMDLKKISQGQKKKALIAFALALRVPLLLLDEPTNGLDIPSKGEFRRAVARYLGEDQTLVISTHQVRDLEQLIDRVVILEKGQIYCNESIADLSEKLYFGPIPSEDQARALYSEPSIVGTVGILPATGEPTEDTFSMELFFNAVVSQRDALLRIIHSSSNPNI